MGHVRATIRITNVQAPDLQEEVPEAMIDTGATWTTIPRALAQRLELPSLGPVTGRTAGGVVTLEQSYALMGLAGRQSVGPLMISDDLDMFLVGVLTLESLALAVDPLNQRLVESELFLL